MKIGLGLYREQLTPENFAFAKQAGATHIVAHLTNYFKGADPTISSGSSDAGWGDCSDDTLWNFDEMSALVANVRAAGLELAAIENFSPKFWYDILLDGPERDRQMDGLKQLVRDAGRAGVPCIGYNFSLAGVYGWTRGPYARGNADSVGFGMEPVDQSLPLPDGVVWNMRYRRPIAGAAAVSADTNQMWDRLSRFLVELVPVAEEVGVVLAAHPDDPPAEQLRGTARLVNRPEKFDRLMGIVNSPANGLELCLGTLQEMPGGDIYEHVRRFARSGRIGYIHFRNVKGKVPHYYEAFVDEGDIDMAEIVRILRDENYQGVLIPDHTPAMSCQSPWHAGKAYALGYMKALVKNADALGASWSLAAAAE
ncbi:MAG TPA: mannonate dehydratase [Devosia sp.]|jgi:mannonate dehydratase|uniref:mannonate dehydratase n=1 Tax=Devosia sp. TaxID=1871048 RepID=UPI002DDD704C|nr:mannonate dehydratase [Devosia sp.]HEV2514348.1 mannonate dehydratase [Devosia sp.]